MILETINGPEDIKHLDRQELETLAGDQAGISDR